MSARILLVTGSRALDDHVQALHWEREQVSARADSFRPTLVVTGDARGPDESARVHAKRRGLPLECWSLSGWVAAWGAGRDRRWWPESEPPLTPRHWPLERNRRMVAHVAELAKTAEATLVLALYAPWSRTQGTAHTVGLARAAGLTVIEATCPAEYGPGVRS